MKHQDRDYEVWEAVWKRHSYENMKKAAAAANEPFRLRLMQYSIFVLAGPDSAWVTAKSS